jgi:DNA-binding NarL/FixJ family response regulator
MSNNINKSRVLIADDHSIILSGIKMILSFQLKISNIFECNNLNELIDIITLNKPSHLILDISFPEGSSLNLLEDITKKYPKLQIMILTMHPKIMFEHVLKKYQKLFFCEKKLSESELTAKLESFLKNANNEITQQSDTHKKNALSKREQQILQLLMAGKTTQGIAGELGIKSNTVSTIKNRIFEKLQVNNLVDLMQLYS